MMGTSYIPFPPWALAFCWLPLWWDLLHKTDSPQEAFKKGWVAQFVLSLIGFHWVAFVAREFGFLPWWAAALVLLAFAALVHLYIPLAAMAAVWLRKRFGLGVGGTLVLLAVFHNLGETYWPSVFSWNFGYPLLWIHSPWAQWADVIGFLGLSLLVHLLNALATWLWIRRDRGLALKWGAGVAAGLVLAHFGGVWKRQAWENPESRRPLKALIVQANIGNLEKYYAERGSGYQREIIEKYGNLSHEGLARHPEAELVIWPESAIPEFLDAHNRERRYFRPFTQTVRSLNRPLVTGAYSNDPPEALPRDDYNSLFLFGPDGEARSLPYHKTHLLMFGEYVPFGRVFPILRKWNPGGEGFGRGSGPMVMELGELKLGPQICYESLDPHFARSSVLQGADLLINITNDSWFGPVSEPEQHLYMTLARAIEVRRPLLRSTNTGISTAIEASGRIHGQSPKGVPWFGLFEIQTTPGAPLTFYTRFGATLPLILFIVIGLVFWRSRGGTSGLARHPEKDSNLRDQRDRKNGPAGDPSARHP